MSLRIGWLTPFTNRTGVGTFGKAVTDAMPERHGGVPIELTIVAPAADGLYRTRHRVIDIASATPDSRFYDLFDIVVCNVGNNVEHHRAIFEVLRNRPAIVILHDHVYQHFLATLVHERGLGFADYVALTARYGGPEALRVVRQSNLTRGRGLSYAPWDSEFSGTEPLASPILHLGAALVVHSAFAEGYVRPRFDGPVLRLGMPFDQRLRAEAPRPPRRRADAEGRRVVVSFGHVQSTKCIDDVLRAIAGSRRLRDGLLYVVSGFAGDRGYVALLRDLVEENGLEACVRFALDLSDAELDALSAEADGFVNLRFPNTEGASVSLIEQLATGKPVVVLDSGCYAEVPDGAAIKVARPRDQAAIRDALLRMLGEGDGLAAIGRRGRAHALRFDCAGYAAGLLDFVGREATLLRRRAGARARCLIEEAPSSPPADPADDRWGDALADARTAFDLLERGRLALDPWILCRLAPDRIVDFVQAAILREGTSARLTAALRAYSGSGADAFAHARILQVVRDGALDGDADALACLAEVCPHGDPTFWEVVAALGVEPLAAVCHHAFFRGTAPGTTSPGHDGATEPNLLRLRIADALGRRDPAGLAAEAGHLDAVLGWLRRIPAVEDHAVLEPLPVGRSVAIGSSEQRRYLRLFGFFKPEANHAWTGVEHGFVYLCPARGAQRIVLEGHTLDGEIRVSVSAQIDAATRLGRMRRAAAGGAAQGDAFEIDVEDGPDAPSPTGGGTLCVTIRSSACRSPATLGLSEDARLLGFCLRQVSVA